MKRRAFLASSLILASGCGLRPFLGFQPFHFIQMADPQLGFSADGNGLDFGAETLILEKVMTGINRMRPSPAFAMVCGDLTHITGHAGQIAEYQRLVRMINPDIRVYCLPGNHDFALTQESLDQYRKTFGPDRYAFTLHGWRFIALNSTLIQAPGKIPSETASQTEWLRKTLSEAGPSRFRGIVVFMHHPFTENDIRGNTPDALRRSYLDLFAEHKVTAVFSGHTHRTVPEDSYGGVRLINTNGLCRSFDNNPGLRVVQVASDRIDHQFHASDRLPEKV